MPYNNELKISNSFDIRANVILYHGRCQDLLKNMPDESVQLIITSPPYNIGKEYEKKRRIKDYLDEQREVITECYRILDNGGSICWQVGNYVNNGEIQPLDILLFPIFSDLKLKLRNRIIWFFEHGLHCNKRFSGRYETILWFTKSDDYKFNLDPIRVPQKYPGKKYFKGPKKGQFSANPKGKNPGDVWDIPNVKHNHPEKTIHPCQFPIELVERFVLSLTDEDDVVFDPFMGVGSTALAAFIHKRRAAGADTVKEYLDIAKGRLKLAADGFLKRRPLFTPKYEPSPNLRVAQRPLIFNPEGK
jgi:adenine-specific DNA-methyltransferase